MAERPIKGREEKDTNKDRTAKLYKQREDDIFLKHGDEDNANHIAIKSDWISAHVDGGNVGVLITNKGDIRIQGRVVKKTHSFTAFETQEVKGDFQENPLAWLRFTDLSLGAVMPHIHMTRNQQLLIRIPAIEFMKDIKSLYQKFLGLFK